MRRRRQGLLPAHRVWSQIEPKFVCGWLYLALLLWCFLGISIVSDILMSAVQRITSSQMRRCNKDTMQLYTVNV